VELYTVQILVSAKLRIGKRGQKPELTGRSPLWRGKSAWDCSSIEEEEEEKEEDFHLMSRLRMSGAMPLLPLCALYLYVY